MVHLFSLERFVEAQRSVLTQVQRELSEGRKHTHWMWFVFPQLRGLGRSETARQFGITNLAEAEAYLHHPVLGSRLVDCTRLVNALEGRTARQIFDNPDDMKFCSSMTLFAAVAPNVPDFSAALSKYFNGRPDLITLRRLKRIADSRTIEIADVPAPQN